MTDRATEQEARELEELYARGDWWLAFTKAMKTLRRRDDELAHYKALAEEKFPKACKYVEQLAAERDAIKVQHEAAQQELAIANAKASAHWSQYLSDGDYKAYQRRSGETEAALAEAQREIERLRADWETYLSTPNDVARNLRTRAEQAEAQVRALREAFWAYWTVHHDCDDPGNDNCRCEKPSALATPPAPAEEK